MKLLSVFIFLIALSAFGGQDKPGVVEKTYDLTDLTLLGWKPPATKPQAGIALTIHKGPPTVGSLMQLLRTQVRPETWDEALDTKLTEQPKSRVLIRQTPIVHETIASFLALLRQAAAAPVGSVTPSKIAALKQSAELEIRIYTVPADTDLEVADTLRKSIKPESWNNPACFVDDFATKTGRIVIINQTKDVHELLRLFLAKAPKRGAK